MERPLRIGTRASKLARVQAQKLEHALVAAHPALALRIEIVAMTTAGDRELHKKLTDWGYKGLFTKELEDALLAQHIDIAVHSMKDMPSVLPEGLVLAAMLPRADVRDAWISTHHATIDVLPQGARVGTSSARRAAQLLHRRPDIHIVPLRGNVETRLRKLEEGEAEATFLAAAGLQRLGLTQHIRSYIDPDIMLPAAAQGAIGMECRADDVRVRTFLTAINHAPTFTCVEAERAYLRTLDGSCQTPIGGLATLHHDRLTLHGEVLSLDGTICHRRSLEGHAQQAEQLGIALGTELRALSGDALLKGL